MQNYTYFLNPEVTSFEFYNLLTFFRPKIMSTSPKILCNSNLSNPNSKLSLPSPHRRLRPPSHIRHEEPWGIRREYQEQPSVLAQPAEEGDALLHQLRVFRAVGIVLVVAEVPRLHHHTADPASLPPQGRFQAQGFRFQVNVFVYL